jgi:hypothetical protein
MKKVKVYKGFVIAESNEREREEGVPDYQVFTKEEWEYGEGLRYPEYDDCGTVKECMECIDGR